MNILSWELIAFILPSSKARKRSKMVIIQQPGLLYLSPCGRGRLLNEVKKGGEGYVAAKSFLALNSCR